MDCKIALFSLLALHACAVLALPPRDPCVCARNFAPVCGSDGKTYSNGCVLNCYNHEHSTEITVDHEGRCKQENCICTLQYEPVCGNDGKTYGNRCSLLCQRSKNPDVDVAYEGECSDKHEVDPPCVCTDHLELVCGSDENTYDNPCLLNCATAKNPMLSIVHQGKCDNRVKVAEPWLGTDNGNQVQVADPQNDKVQVAVPQVSQIQVAVPQVNEVQVAELQTNEVQVAEPQNDQPQSDQPQNDQVQVAEPQSDQVQVAESQNDQVQVAEPSNDQVQVAESQNDQVQVAKPPNDQVQVADPQNDQVQVAELQNDQVQVAYPGNTKVQVAYPKIDKDELAKHQSALAAHDKVHVVNPSSSSNHACVCPRNLEPVCGSDGVTYNNECLLRCAGETVNLARSNGPCDVDLARYAP